MTDAAYAPVMGFFWQGLPRYVLAWAHACAGPSASFVETGTYRGDTAAEAAFFFSAVDTIEVDPDLGRRAEERFRLSSVRCHIGDSRQILPTVLPGVERPLILWLDAHYSGGVTGGVEEPCPVEAELRIVVAQREPSNTIIAIDDVRCFTGLRGFPRLDALAAVLGQKWAWLVVDDVLIATNVRYLDALLDTRDQWRIEQSGSIFGFWTGVRAASWIRSRAASRFTRSL